MSELSLSASPPGTDGVGTAVSGDNSSGRTAAFMTVQAGSHLWVVPPHQAMWIPPGVTHTVEMAGRGLSQRLYLRRQRAAPREARDLVPLSRQAGASVRTLERPFRSETGLRGYPPRLWLVEGQAVEGDKGDLRLQCLARRRRGTECSAP